MGTQTVNSSVIIIDDDNDEESDKSNYFTFSKHLSGRGSTQNDPISVENYDVHRHRHLNIKSEFLRSNFIDLDQYNYNDDDDVKILSFPPVTKFEKGQSSRAAAKVEGESQSQSSTFDCEICVDTKPSTESFRISGCSHSYCNECVSRYIAAKLQDNLLTITCPVSGCSGNLEPDKCREILPQQVFDRWGDALCEALVMRSKKRFYCPYKECSALVFVEEEKMSEAECPHCYRMVCVACETKWHPEISCKEYQKLAENERGRDDILLKKMAESNRWARCPSCKFYVEKTQGCLYIMCRCGLAFCYNCGTPSRDHSHYCHNCKH